MDKTLPHKPEYEQAILTEMLRYPESREQILDLLSTNDFYGEKHQLIFRTCKELHKTKKTIDLVTVKDLLTKNKQIEKVGSYLSTLFDGPLPSNISEYASEIHNTAVLRDGIINISKIEKACYEGAEGTLVISDIQSAMRKIEGDLYTKDFIPADPFKSLSEDLADKQERDEKRESNKPLGFVLNKFKGLSKNIDGVQPGFYVVGADTNTGKTALLCNLTIDLLESNKDLTAIYFSLDDNKNVILNRFLAISSGVPLNQVQRRQDDKGQRGMLEKGYKQLKGLAENRRLYVRDASEIENAEDLELEIKRRMSDRLFVVIDGLYNLDIGKNTGDPRKENIERANRLKTLSDVYGIPLICSGEFRKKTRGEEKRIPALDDIMESGKFAYNANLVLLIYPEDQKEYENSEIDRPVLKMRYGKNKLSHFRGTTDILFERMTGRIEEKAFPWIEDSFRDELQGEGRIG